MPTRVVITEGQALKVVRSTAGEIRRIVRIAGPQGTPGGTGAKGDPGDVRVPFIITQQAGTSYTLTLDDAGTEVETTNAAAVTVTVPPNADVAFPVGTVVALRQYGAGQITVAAGAGVTIRAPYGSKSGRQYATMSLVKRATNEWILSGDAVS